MDEITNNQEQNQNEQQPLAIVLDDRKVSVPVVNTLGEQIGVFRFDPTDIAMVDRYNEVAEKFTTALQTIESAGGIDELNKAGDKIIEFLDYVLGGNSREAFFASVHPLSPQNGHFYCEQVFEVIGAFIKKSFEAENNKIDQRIAAHTHGYRTGKHAKGDR